MKFLLAFILLVNSFGVVAAPRCDTAGQLMSSGIVGKEFSNICRKVIAQDEGCKKLKPEKRMNCSTKSANNILSSNDLANKIGQCVKGFVWDSMVDLVKFVLSLIKTMVGAQISTVTGMIRFLSDSDYRAKMISAAEHGAGTSFRFAKAFLNSSALYFAREYPKNLQNNYFNPIAALGETLAKPLINFITESVQQIAAYYIPQYQCMNGTAKLYTICRVMGEFIMPPVFLFTFLKTGIKGLQALKAGANAAKIARAERRFKEANELQAAARVARDTRASRITVDQAPRSPARIRNVPRPEVRPQSPAVAHPARPAPAAPLVKPIEEHSADELIEVARSEHAETRAVADANRAELARIEDQQAQVLIAEEQAGRLAIDSQVDELIAGTKNSPALIIRYAEDPEYSALFKAEKAYPEQGRDIAIVIADMEKKNPQMTKPQIREEIEKFLNTCAIRK